MCVGGLGCKVLGSGVCKGCVRVGLKGLGESRGVGRSRQCKEAGGKGV